MPTPEVPEVPSTRIPEQPATPQMSSAASDAIKKILALRALTKATGNITTRAQNAILRPLSDSALTEVALVLPLENQ